MNNITILRDYMHSIKDDWNYITPMDFYNNYYLTNKDYLLIDLRKEKEYKRREKYFLVKYIRQKTFKKVRQSKTYNLNLIL
jgi:hypothetical protein